MLHVFQPSSHRFLTTIQRRKLKHFGHVIRTKTSLQIYCMVASMVADLEASQNDVSQMM